MFATLMRLCRPAAKPDQSTTATRNRAGGAGDMRRVRPMSFQEKMRRDPFERLAKV